jgi:uncharacterized membrane protein HdeD (DUF308 family)
MNQFEFLIPIAFFVIVAVVIKIITDNRTRQKLIDKGMVDERTKYLFVGSAPQSLTSLKWGMVLIAVGLALAIVNMFPLALEGPAAIGLMLLFAGIAFLVYYMVAKKHEAKNGQ